MADLWLRDICETYLEFGNAEWDACIDDHSKPKSNGNAVDDFLGPSTGKGTSLFMYSMVISEEKEVKVKRKREIVVAAPAPAISALPVSDQSAPEPTSTSLGAPTAAGAAPTSDDAVTPTATMSHSAIQESKEKEAADAAPVSADGTEPSGDESAPAAPASTTDVESATLEASAGPAEAVAEAVVAAPPPATRIIEEEVIEKVVTKRFVLHAALKAMPSGVSGVNVVFFVKSKEGSVSPPASDLASPALQEYMADAIEFGSLSTDILGGLEAVVRHVYTPFLEPQLGGKGSGSGPNGGADDDATAIREEDQSVGSGQVGTAGTGIAASGAPSIRSGIAGSVVQQQQQQPSRLTTSSMGRTLGPRTVTGGSVVAGSSAATSGPGAVAVKAYSYPSPVAEDKDLTGVNDSVKGEFKSALSRFATVISHTMQQVSADVRIAVPNVAITEPAAAAEDQALLTVLVDAVESWTKMIIAVTGTVTESDKGTRPLQEVEFWRGRNARLSTVYDSVDQPAVGAMLQVLEVAREPALDAYRLAAAELSRAYVEARDNVKVRAALLCVDGAVFVCCRC